jgi:hypothetical protein
MHILTAFEEDCVRNRSRSADFSNRNLHISTTRLFGDRMAKIGLRDDEQCSKPCGNMKMVRNYLPAR